MCVCVCVCVCVRAAVRSVYVYPSIDVYVYKYMLSAAVRPVCPERPRKAPGAALGRPFLPVPKRTRTPRHRRRHLRRVYSHLTNGDSHLGRLGVFPLN